VKRALQFGLSAAVFASVGFVSVGTADAVAPATKVHVAIHNPVATRSWPLSVQAWVARIWKEECQVFPVFCAFVRLPVTTVAPPPTTVPSATVSTTTTVVPPPTTVTSVPTTVTTTVPSTVITLPVVVVPVPLAQSSGSTCTVTMTGGGVSQCNQSASVSSSS
jgi:hypothetical protein